MINVLIYKAIGAISKRDLLQHSRCKRSTAACNIEMARHRSALLATHSDV
ncbi:hypothetical protein N509_01048, partial [Brucella abortus BC95]